MRAAATGQEGRAPAPRPGKAAREWPRLAGRGTCGGLPLAHVGTGRRQAHGLRSTRPRRGARRINAASLTGPLGSASWLAAALPLAGSPSPSAWLGPWVGHSLPVGAGWGSPGGGWGEPHRRGRVAASRPLRAATLWRQLRPSGARPAGVSLTCPGCGEFPERGARYGSSQRPGQQGGAGLSDFFTRWSRPNPAPAPHPGGTQGAWASVEPAT